MAYLNTERPPSKWDAAWFKKFVERLRTSVNFMGEDNFPDGIHGSLLLDRTVPLPKLSGFEIRHTIIASPTSVSVTATEPATYGGAYTWSPSAWGSKNHVSVYLEVVGAIGNSAGTATFTLEGVNGVVVTLTTNATTLTTLRSNEIPMPDTAQTLLFKVKTSNASYAAGFVSAHLVITPKSAL